VSSVELPEEVSFTAVLRAATHLYVARLKSAALLFGLISFGISLLAVLGLTGTGRLELFAAFLTQIVLPSILGSVGIAVASVLHDGAQRNATVTLKDAIDALRPMRRDILVASVFSSLLALWAVILIGQSGLILLPLFFGPPILVQVISLEKLSLKEARTRARNLLKGRTTRVLLYLLVIALGIAFIAVAILAPLLAALEGSSGALPVSIFSISQVVVAALTLPFMAASEFVCYATLVRIEKQEPPSSPPPEV
jgi:hypothetical protein